jgi:hypothetical protein
MKWEKNGSSKSRQLTKRYLTKAVIDVGCYGGDYRVSTTELHYSAVNI